MIGNKLKTKRFWLIIFLVIAIELLLALPFWPLRYRQLLFSQLFLFVIPVVLIVVPCKVLKMQGKEARLSAEIGLIIGAVAGWFFGVKTADFILNIIYGDMSKYSIRIDLLCAGFLGVSIFASLGAIVGGRLSKNKKSE